MSEETVNETTEAASISGASSSKLTNAQKARIERNQAKAQKLREAKLVSHPYKHLQKYVKQANIPLAILIL